MFEKNDTLVFQGDSITDCGRNREDNASYGYGYANLLTSMFLYESPELRLNIVNRGVGGDCVTHMHDRFEEDCHRLKPNVLSILIGVNDVWSRLKHGTGVSADKFETTYRLLLKEAVELNPKLKLILMEPFVLEGGLPEDYAAFRKELDARRGIVRAIAADFKATFVPLQMTFDLATQAAPDTYWLYDGVHPTAAGHMLIAQEWMKAAL